jgi:heme a synthase
MRFEFVKKILLGNLIAQAAIIVTGATVRLTGSGLGCPSWPQCTPGSFTPTFHQAEGYHKYIEFGNRTLTGVLAILAILSVITVFKTRTDKRIRRIAVIPLAGTVVQAVLGGITVLTDLNSAVVIVHLMVSIYLVAVSVYLYDLYVHPNQTPTSVVSAISGKAVLFAALAVVALGSLVTNSGPHSGDADVASALPFDPVTLAWIHAESVWLFVGVLFAAWLLVKAEVIPKRAIKSLQLLTLGTAIQGVIGYTQYFTGLPILLVGIHVVMAVLIWIAAVYVSRRARFEIQV